MKIHGHDAHEWMAILAETSVLKRLMRARKHTLAFGIGILVMLTGSCMAVTHQSLLPTAVWDAVAYFLHGIGAVPVIKHIEPLWDILTLE